MTSVHFAEPVSSMAGQDGADVLFGGAVDFELIENKLRAHAYTKRVRVIEFFRDFDRLRSGCISATQFRRALSQNFESVLTDREAKVLSDKYDYQNNGNIHYRDFCDSIDSVNTQKNLEKFPSMAVQAPDQFMATVRNSMSPGSQEAAYQVLEKVAAYCQYHGVNVKAGYSDFDKHHNGLITLNQFYRQFPGPPDVTKEEMDTLARKYRDPTTDYLNYFAFQSEVARLTSAMEEQSKQAMKESDSVLPPPLPCSETPDMGGEDIVQIEERMRMHIFKHRLRVIEYFSDYDKLRHGRISENQFICGLGLCRFKLTRDEIQKITEHYRLKTRNGRGDIDYKSFCESLDTVFTIKNLEKNPDLMVLPPDRKRLVKDVNWLSPEEEQRHDEIIADLRRRVETRRLATLAFFQNFDMGMGKTFRVTKNHFRRLLAVLSLEVPDEEMDILTKKYEDDGGDINYGHFIREIDLESLIHASAADEPEPTPMADLAAKTVVGAVQYKKKARTVNELMESIRYAVLLKRVRVSEFFRDFDKLRHGYIRRHQFEQGISAMGFSFDQGDLANLCHHYCKPNSMGQDINWTRFCDDVDKVFTEKDLERKPTKRVQPLRDPREIKPVGKRLSPELERLVDNILHQLHVQAERRRIMLKPCFTDFDKHHTGHVSRTQFRQCLGFLNFMNFTLTEPEIEACLAKYTNADGQFNYLTFLNDVEKVVPFTEPPSSPQLKSVPGSAGSSERKDPERLLSEIKTKVKKERVRVLGFLRDYDKLNSGRIHRTTFVRAINSAGIVLSQDDYNLLSDMFASPVARDTVDYQRFSDELESVFTRKNLEKTPTAEVQKFECVKTQDIELSAKEEAIMDACMHRMAEKVRVHGMIILPFFEDFDKIHNGSISKHQFRRLLGLIRQNVSDEESNIMCKKFAVKVGGKDDVDYNHFCRIMDEYSKHKYTEPQNQSQKNNS